MTFCFQATPHHTAFVIASNFKDIAIFKPKAWRDWPQPVDADIVWYSQYNKAGHLMRVSGNLWRYTANVRKGSLEIIKH